MAGGKNKHILKFSSPARWWGSSWREALVSGNGIIGCSVLGGAAEDSIMLTHGDLWWQGKVGVLPEVCGNLEKVKKLINECRYDEASQVLPDALIAKGYRPSMSYPLPICDFKISMALDNPPKDYSRSVNMDTGEITVAFRDGNTKFERSVFVSKTQEYVVFEISKTGTKTINADFTFALHEKFNNRTPQAFTNLPEGVVSKTEGKVMYFSARSDNGTDFGAVAAVNYFGGTLVTTEDTISVKGAEKLFIIIKPFINVKTRDAKIKEIAAELKAVKLTYDKMLKEQTAAASKIVGKSFLELSDDESFVEALLGQTVSGEVSAALIEKLWYYGRYLFTSAASPSSAPVPPYGIWCGDFKGVDSHLNANGSLQLCYEHALAGNLTDYLSALFTYYENVIDDLKKNAIRLFDCRGVMIPSVTARGTGLVGQTSAEAIHFTGAAGWLCKLMYDAYLMTADQKLLKRILPFMKETAQFYLDFFKVQEDSFFESLPSYCPNSKPAGAEDNAAVKNALIDFAIARELFTNLIEGSIETNTSKTEIDKWKEFLQHIPPYKTNQDGMVMEYFDSKVDSGKSSGSIGMFYPVYPGGESDLGEMLKAFEKTAQKRFSFGSHHTSASLASYANLFIRLNQPQTANDIISALLRFTAMGNLIFAGSDWSGMGIAKSDIWANFSIESNLILAGAIQEMFVQSDKDAIWLLPACAYTKGELGGFLTRTGVEIVSFNWDRKKGGISLKLKAKKSRSITLKLTDAVKRYKGIGNVDTETNSIKDIELPAGKIISLDIKI